MADPSQTTPELQPAEPPAPPPSRGPLVQPGPVPAAPITERLSENAAGALSYLLGWVSGLIFLFVDRRAFVRYHAAQSVVVFATLNLVLLVLGDFFLSAFLPREAGFFFVLRRIVELIWLVAAVVLMLKAASGQRYRVPYAAGYADRAAHEDAHSRGLWTA